MDDLAVEEPKKPTRKIFGIVILIIGVGLILYLIFGTTGSEFRDDDVSISQIQSEAQDHTVVLFFWGDYCGYCDEQKPIMNDLEDDYDDQNVTFYWLNVQKHADIKKEYDVSGVPTTVVINHNGVLKKIVGYSDYDPIASAIEASIETY